MLHISLRLLYVYLTDDSVLMSIVSSSVPVNVDEKNNTKGNAGDNTTAQSNAQVQAACVYFYLLCDFLMNPDVGLSGLRLLCNQRGMLPFLLPLIKRRNRMVVDRSQSMSTTLLMI